MQCQEHIERSPWFQQSRNLNTVAAGRPKEVGSRRPSRGFGRHHFLLRMEETFSVLCTESSSLRRRGTVLAGSLKLATSSTDWNRAEA